MCVNICEYMFTLVHLSVGAVWQHLHVHVLSVFGVCLRARGRKEMQQGFVTHTRSCCSPGLQFMLKCRNV